MEQQATSRVEFKPPPDFRPPADSEPGKDWDMVCSFRTKPDGSICLTKLGDTQMPGYGEDDHDDDRNADHKPGYQNLSSGIMNAMGGQSGASGSDNS